MGALARPERPLVLFLDDLQWADPASLALIVDLVTQTDPCPLLLVGAVALTGGAALPLVGTLGSIAGSGALGTIAAGAIQGAAIGAIGGGLSRAGHCR